MAVFPALQGGPHNHQIGALASQLLEVNTPDFVEYSKKVVENAKTQSQKLNKPLYIIQAKDEPVYSSDERKLTQEVAKELLSRANPEQTKSLPGFLPLYEGMELLLNSKDCVRFGVVKGCPCIVEEIVFTDEEPLPYEHVVGRPHH